MDLFLEQVKQTVDGLTDKNDYIKNNKFWEAIDIINNAACSLCYKTGYASDIIDAFQCIFLLGDESLYHYEEIDRIISDFENLQCSDVPGYIRDVYFDIVDTASKRYNNDEQFTFILDTISAINKYQHDYANNVLLNNSFAALVFNWIKKISASEESLADNIKELNCTFLENCNSLEEML